MFALTLFLTPASPLTPAQAFGAELMSARSATAVLQAHCPDASIRAEKVSGGRAKPPSLLRHRLSLQPGETLRHRRVLLRCGKTVYSEADNWYVPERLTPAINETLESGDIPFGRAVAPLGVTRSLIDQSFNARGTRVPERFLTVRALVVTDRGVPLAAVIERYRRAVLERAG